MLEVGDEGAVVVCVALVREVGAGCVVVCSEVDVWGFALTSAGCVLVWSAAVSVVVAPPPPPQALRALAVARRAA